MEAYTAYIKQINDLQKQVRDLQRIIKEKEEKMLLISTRLTELIERIKRNEEVIR